jgi:uncharacterized membrane protein
MTALTFAGPTVLASFLASMVEFVEALTIVLAVGLTRGWRSSLLGTAAGLAVLAALVLALGSSFSALPLPLLQVVVGMLLLMFGLRWLQKAILRGAGVVALHDEAKAFSRETEALRAIGRPAGSRLDWIGFVTTFKTVMLEGIEVVFVVVALGVRGGLLVPAAVGALLALLLVTALGLLLHRPLARVPENSLKFAVGVMLTAFGTYWVGEGIGLVWPAQDATILLLVALFLGLALGLVNICGRLRATWPAAGPALLGTPAAVRGRLASIAAEVFGLVVDDPWLAVGVAAWVIAAGLVEAQNPPGAMLACTLFAAGLAAILSFSAVRRARAPARLRAALSAE